MWRGGKEGHQAQCECTHTKLVFFVEGAYNICFASFVLFALRLSVRLCWPPNTAAGTFPTRRKSALIGAPAPRSLKEAPLAQKSTSHLGWRRLGIAAPVTTGRFGECQSHVSHVSSPLNATRSPIGSSGLEGRGELRLAADRHAPMATNWFGG